MTVRDLKRKLADANDDLEVYAAPLVEMKELDDQNPNKKVRVASPFVNHEITNIVETGSVGGGGVYNLRLLFAFDDSVNCDSNSLADSVAGGDGEDESVH